MKAGLERAEQGTNLSGAPDKKNTFLNESAQTAYKDMRKSRKGFNQSKYFCWSVQVVIWQIELAFFPRQRSAMGKPRKFGYASPCLRVYRTPTFWHAF